METTRLSDIVDSCTDWPTDTEFGSVFQYQNIDAATRVTLAGNDSSLDTIRLGFCPKQLWPLVKPGSKEADVQLFGTMATMERKAAQTLFDTFCAYVADIKAPDGPDYQSGDPNRSKLRPYRQSTVRPAPEPVRTVMDQSGLLVLASYNLPLLQPPYPPTTSQSYINLPSHIYLVETIASDTLITQQSHFLDYSADLILYL